MAVPATSASFDPNGLATRPAAARRSPIVRAVGSRWRLDTTADAPNPKPVLFGSCANCGKTTNDEYMPAPSRNAARLVVHTPRIRIIVMSTSGSRLRTSTAIQAKQNSSPKPNSPMVLAPPQPQTVVSAIAISTPQTPTLISVAASQFTLPGERTGDSGMYLRVANAASSVTASGIQNSQCQPSCSSISAPATSPQPAPTPRIEDISPMLPATLSAGNSSRAIEKASGKIPPPTPCTTRAAISMPSD